MRVQRVLMPGSEVESWTVLDDDLLPLDPVKRFLAYLAAIERSLNTVKAYAHDLKDWFAFPSGRDLDWRAVTLEDVAGFVAWRLRGVEAVGAFGQPPPPLPAIPPEATELLTALNPGGH